MKAKIIGYIGIAVTVVALLMKAWHCLDSVEERMDMSMVTGLVIGFALIHSAALLQLQERIDRIEKKRKS